MQQKKKQYFKKTILLDFDGVLNKYTGKYDKNIIPEIKEGAFEFLVELSKNYEVKIFSTRDKNDILMWLQKYDLLKYIKEITNKKDPAFLIIDDRAICFNGNFNETLNKVGNFKPYYKLN